MTKRYVLRHSSLGEEIGPYTADQLRASLEAGALPTDSEVRGEGDSTSDWQPVTELLGLPAPDPAAAPPPQARPPHVRDSHTVLGEVRSNTAYESFRALISIAAVTGVLITLTTMISVLNQARSAPTAFVLTALAGSALQVLTILVAARALRALADIADCALRRDRGN